jgi:hypothetical protein
LFSGFKNKLTISTKKYLSFYRISNYIVMPPKRVTRVTQHGAHGSNSNDSQPMDDQVIASTSTDSNLKKRKATPVSKILGPVNKKTKVTNKEGGKQSPHSSSLIKKGPAGKPTSKAVSFNIENSQSSDDSMSNNDDTEMDESDNNDIEMVEEGQKDSNRTLSQNPPIYNLNSMTKSMQVFKGAADDHFETFEENTRLYLNTQYPYAPEETKVTAVLLKIQGYPRMILRQHHPYLKTLDELFDALRPTYGADEFTMINETKQLPDESVRVFFSRLKTNLYLLGYTDASKGNRIFLSHFINGLHPGLRTAVKALKPQRIEDAVSVAQEVESDRLTDDSRKGKKEKLDTLNQMSDSASLNVINDKIEQMGKMIQDKLNAVNGRISDQIGKVNAFSPCTNAKTSSDNNFSTSYHRRNENQGRRGYASNNSSNNSTYRSQCFGCNQSGHSYRQCRLLSQSQQDQLREELRSFYLEAQRTNPNVKASIANFKPSFTLNSSGTAAPPQAPLNH